MNDSGNRLIIALDFAEADRAIELTEELSPLGVGFKIGLELFISCGPNLVKKLADKYRIFLDLKFHDIPNTVHHAVKSAASLGVWMINVHASGGREMMIAAREALEGFETRPLLIAVTVLTSLNESQLQEIGFQGTPVCNVMQLTHAALDSGLDGIVCSPLEVSAIRKAFGSKVLTVTPGVRPTGYAHYDQSRVDSPENVISAGGNFIVIGRPVTRAADPFKAAEKIISEIAEVAGNGK
ncbi:MAG: orotidine-5'-phosphate decarboxylase [Bacillota bacterium]|nr:orotidine-5'-phosphate decarboxylase [Bacillota bacterium]